MKPLAMVKVKRPDISYRVALMTGGWQVVGQPESRIALILNTLTMQEYTPDEGNSIPQIARHAAQILGGTYKVYPRPKPKPGMIY